MSRYHRIRPTPCAGPLPLTLSGPTLLMPSPTSSGMPTRGLWAPPVSIWGFSHPFYPPPALLLLYPRKPIGCSLGWHTRATILPSGLLHAFGVWSFGVPLWTPLAGLRARTLVRAVLPFFCLPISGIFCFCSFLFLLFLLPSRCPCFVSFTLLYLYFAFLCFFTSRDVARQRGP